MKIARSRYLLLSTAAIVLLAGQLASAQTPLEPAQMPANTAFYLIWRGQPSAEIRKKNSIAALWDDPGFAPVRSAVTKALLKNSEEKSTGPRLTSAQLEEYATLLENPFVLGYLSDPQKHVAASANPGPAKTQWNGMFFVYDRSGKEALLSKAVLALRGSEKEIPQISQVTIGNVPALKVQRKSGATYWVENGKYAVSANEIAVLEEILPRLNAGNGAHAASGGLGDSAAFKEARPLLGSGPVEFFLRVPNLKEFASGTRAGVFSVGPLLDAMKLDAIHSFSGHVTLEGSRTRLQIAVLGDTAPGSLFDIWDQGAQSPASLDFVPAGAVSFSDTHFNLRGLYDAVQRIAHSVLPPGQGNGDMLENMAQARLGQPLSTAIALFTGEFASLQTSPSLDSNKQIYLVGIRNKPDTLKLLRTVLSDRITSERSEGETTFLKISAEGGQQSAGTAQWNFYHAAVTPNSIVVASRLETVRELLAKHAQGSDGGLTATPEFKTARAQFPAQVNGLGYFDFRKLDWRAMKERMIAESKKTSPAKRRPGATDSAPGVPPAWIMEMNPEVFAKHLHVTSSASWKDAQGLHFDQWIE